jgi:hypothetical protein
LSVFKELKATSCAARRFGGDVASGAHSDQRRLRLRSGAGRTFDRSVVARQRMPFHSGQSIHRSGMIGEQLIIVAKGGPATKRCPADKKRWLSGGRSQRKRYCPSVDGRFLKGRGCLQRTPIGIPERCKLLIFNSSGRRTGQLPGVLDYFCRRQTPGAAGARRFEFVDQGRKMSQRCRSFVRSDSLSVITSVRFQTSSATGPPGVDG